MAAWPEGDGERDLVGSALCARRIEEALAGGLRAHGVRSEPANEVPGNTETLCNRTTLDAHPRAPVLRERMTGVGEEARGSHHGRTSCDADTADATKLLLFTVRMSESLIARVTAAGVGCGVPVKTGVRKPWADGENELFWEKLPKALEIPWMDCCRCTGACMDRCRCTGESGEEKLPPLHTCLCWGRAGVETLLQFDPTEGAVAPTRVLMLDPTAGAATFTRVLMLHPSVSRLL